MFDRMKEDIKTVFSHDPAAKSTVEVLLCYPGLHALWLHRLANWFWRKDHLVIGRIISNINRFITGIEIHPAATIGRRFFIDHGMGIVIGETTIIKDDVLLYKGVVLGGTSLEKKKRHPTIGNGVVVGTSAIILGNIEIGDNSKIGAGSVVIKSAPPGSTIVGIPGKTVRSHGEKIEPDVNLEHGNIPDPITNILNVLIKRQEYLEKTLCNKDISKEDKEMMYSELEEEFKKNEES